MFAQPIPPAIKSHIDIQITLYTDLTQRALEALQSLSELNLQLGRDLIAEFGANIQRIMASKDAAQLGSAVGAQFTPGWGALQNYQQHLVEILSRANSSLAQTAATHMPAVRRAATDAAEEIMHQASEQTARTAEQMSKYQMASELRH
ncbi:MULTISPECIES: TIGR01841 family phasin [unclassified Duganella]|uniref:TIGR01841 family phasin n=1 Tax=unclassified Duganella TaxID=2636909 RepID=UPI000E35650A|nr:MULTISPECIES: TIGR01841 family phasin [unclassified Duganella]RFP15921.1 hypothetical protein D0T23_08430 [Duganella sp. BJB475]RFP32914.1 hypothetical protein D0T21_12200 [Duganella sp. BJB476]